MNERIAKIRTDLQEFWSSRTKKQKITYIGSAGAVILIAAFLTFFLSRTNYVTLYSDVSRAEIGRIKEQLDSQGVTSKIGPGGSAILVPEERVDDLLVSLAAEGFPASGTPGYAFFFENAGFGTTDNEFDMIKLGATQTEIANLLKGIDGVQDAKVAITLPKQGVFLNDTTQKATAAVTLKTNPGQQFNESQINALYNLVANGVSNLSPEDITIINQYAESFDYGATKNSYGTNITDQMTVKKTIEKDLQRQIQMMLGTMMGQDKVIVSVTTDIDFKLENREENLVLPVDEESMEGIALSVQRITETFTGDGALAAGGTPEGEDPTDNRTGFVEGTTSNGDYERLEETINNEVNRIRKEIVESPYKIRDIGIQVMVDGDGDSVPADLKGEIENILKTIARTSVDKVAAGENFEETLDDKVIVSVQPFNGNVDQFATTKSVIPLWVYIVGAALILIIIVLIIIFFRSKRKARELEEETIIEEQLATFDVDDINSELETEGTVRRKQLEKMAKEKPEEFAKLLRTWIADE